MAILGNYLLHAGSLQVSSRGSFFAVFTVRKATQVVDIFTMNNIGVLGGHFSLCLS